MKAAYYRQKGDPFAVLHVGSRPTPVPGDAELLVRVAYSAVHPADAKRRAGLLGNDSFDEIIPHSDGSGTVVAAGTHIVPAEWVGKQVWMYNAQRGRAHGTASEYVALPVRQCRLVPSGYSLRDAAAIGIPMLCSHAAVFHAGAVKGKTVVITGAAGAVGRNAIQWARWGGARRIFAVVRNASQAALAMRLGATESLICCAEDTAPAGLPGGQGFADLVVDVDIGRNASWVQRILGPSGVWSAFASSVPIALDFRSLVNCNATIRLVQTHSLKPEEVQRALDDIDLIHADRAVLHHTGPVFPLEEIARAHALFEEGQRPQSTVLISIGENTQ